MRRVFKPILIATLIIITAVFVKGSVQLPAIGNWLAAGPMLEARSGAASVLVQDGRILITGGDNGSGPVASAELFDITGTSSAFRDGIDGWKSSGSRRIGGRGDGGDFRSGGECVDGGCRRNDPRAFESHSIVTGGWTSAFRGWR